LQQQWLQEQLVKALQQQWLQEQLVKALQQQWLQEQLVKALQQQRLQEQLVKALQQQRLQEQLVKALQQQRLQRSIFAVDYEKSSDIHTVSHRLPITQEGYENMGTNRLDGGAPQGCGTMCLQGGRQGR
jgi:hypothetical protein